MKLSIVTTLYKSAPFIEEFHRRLSATAAALTADYELIFVNDGSPDESLDIAVKLQQRDPHVKVVELSRNFGHHKAIMTGLAHACGELVFCIDVDLEEEPELLAVFHEKLRQEPDCDVVYALLDRRKGGFTERAGGAAFYFIFNLLSQHHIPKEMGMTRLMRRDYVRALLQHQDQQLFLAGLWVLTGFKQVPLTITKRSHGRTSYSLGRRIALMVDAITSFSGRPLVCIFYLGVLIMFLAGTAALALMLCWYFFGGLQLGWPSLIISLWLLGGINIFCIGIVGIYLSKVFLEVKARPYTIVKRLYGFRPRSAAQALINSEVHPQ